MNLKSKDTITWKETSGEMYKGVVTWLDFHTRELGVSLIAPKDVRGGYKVIPIETKGLRVIESFTPNTFKQNLSQVSTDDLRLEMEEIRKSRKGMGTMVKRRKTRTSKVPLTEGQKQVAKLSAAELNKILGA